MNGVIQRLVRDKGFGFIAQDETGIEHFFHRSACQGVLFEHLKEGETVSFDSTPAQKGPRAENVARK